MQWNAIGNHIYEISLFVLNLIICRRPIVKVREFISIVVCEFRTGDGIRTFITHIAEIRIIT